MHQDFIVKNWGIWPPLKQRTNVITQNQLLSSIPKMLKRRLSPLAQIVFCAASQCIDKNTDIPTIFSSTHGELAKSFNMMKIIETGEEISPTAFSLSVHNSIAGLFSMAYANKAQCTVVAPGEDGISAAFIEAAGLLQEGIDGVLIILYDEPLEPFYPSAPYHLTASASRAIALSISKSGTGIPLHFSHIKKTGNDGEQPLQIPLLIDFLSTSQKKLIINTPRHGWCWEKND